MLSRWQVWGNISAKDATLDAHFQRSGSSLGWSVRIPISISKNLSKVWNHSSFGFGPGVDYGRQIS